MQQQKKNSFIISGEPGAGKSYFIRQEAKKHNAKLFRWNVRIDRSLREGREILHQQVRSKEPLYIWIEGADDLTQESQAFLRRILETSSANVTSMLEVREPWKLSPPILSRCIPICMNNTESFRRQKNMAIAIKNNLIKVLPILDYNNINIVNIRRQGYDPYEIIFKLAEKYKWNKEILSMIKKIGAGYSPWIQLAYFIAVCSETKHKTF